MADINVAMAYKLADRDDTGDPDDLWLLLAEFVRER